MNEQDVASIAEQFGLDKEIVEASAKDGTLGQRIKDSFKDKVIYSKNDFETFQSNLKKETINSYFSELVENAKKADIPQDLYAPIKGAAYQQLERELSKKLGVTEYKDVIDLVEKGVKTSANEKTDPELLHQLEELKEVNQKLQEEKENAVKTVEQKYREQQIERDKNDLLQNVPFDFSAVKSEELKSAKEKTQTLLKRVFDGEYKLDYNDKNQLIVIKGEDVLKNPATLEPLPAKDVMINLAKEYNLKLQSPDSGGQGGSSSARSSYPFTDTESYYAYCGKNNINPHSPEGLKMWKESGIK